MHILSNPISALNVREAPKFSRLKGNRGQGTRQILYRKWKCGRFAHAQWKIRNITFIYGRIAEISASVRKSGSRNTMVTWDLRAEVEIWPFRARAMLNLSSSNLFNFHQCAYRKHQCTETVLLYLHDHLINAIGSRKISCSWPLIGFRQHWSQHLNYSSLVLVRS